MNTKPITEIINLTPHEMAFMPQGMANPTLKPYFILPACTDPTRLLLKCVHIGWVYPNGNPALGIRITKTVPSEVVMLPPPKEGTIYVVSELVAQFMKGKRDDLYVANGLVKALGGKVVGCRSISKLED